MILFYYGADSFRSHEHLVRTISAFREKRDVQGINIFQFDMKNANTRDVFEAISSVPFMAEKKMVVVKHCFAEKSDFLEMLEAQFDVWNKRDDLVLCLYEAESLGKSGLAKKCSGLPYAQEFLQMTSGECMGWIQSRFELYKLTAENDALRILSDSFLTDVWALSQVIEQLASYVKADARAIITPNDCALFLPQIYDDNTFHYVDAVNSGDAGRALRLLQDQWSSGKQVLEVLGLLMWQWRTMLRVKALLQRELNFRGKDVARELGLHHFVADKTVKLVKEKNFDDLMREYDVLLNMDASAKSGGNVEAELVVFSAR